MSDLKNQLRLLGRVALHELRDVGARAVAHGMKSVASDANRGVRKVSSHVTKFASALDDFLRAVEEPPPDERDRNRD